MIQPLPPKPSPIHLFTTQGVPDLEVLRAYWAELDAAFAAGVKAERKKQRERKE